MLIKLYKIFYLFVLSTIVSSPVFSQRLEVKFKHLTTEHGLSQNQVTSIYQDKLGLLWFGTQDGLNLYDGYKFTVFRHKPGNENSLPDYAINTICETDTGIFWIGTREGFSRFDLHNGTFKNFSHTENNPNSLIDNIVWNIIEGSDGNLWIATRNGLSRYDPLKDKFNNYKYNPDSKNSLSGNFVFSLVEDKLKQIWIGGKGGLDMYDPVTDRISNFRLFADKPNDVLLNGITALYAKNDTLWIGSYSGLYSTNIKEIKSGNVVFKKHISEDLHFSIRSIFVDDKGTVWAGSVETGLIRYFPSTGKKIVYESSSDPGSLSEPYIVSLLMDKSGVLWIGTYSSGLNKFNTFSEEIKTLKLNYSDEIYGSEITSLLEDDKNNLWIGTGTGNIIRLSDQHSDQPSAKTLISSNEKRSFFGGVEIRILLQDKKGKIWAGTFGNGLYCIDPSTFSIEHFKRRDNPDNFLNSDFIHSVYESSDGTLWFGTGAGGLTEYNPETKSIKIYKNNPSDKNSLSTNEVSAIHEDAKGFIWAGTTTGGLNRFDRSTGIFKRFEHKAGDLSSLSSNRIICICMDRNSVLWVGTFGGGLNRWDPDSNSFIHYSTDDGLPSNIIYSVVQDNSGIFWISTDKGISMFNPDLNTFKNFDANDGLQGNEFIQNCGFYSSEDQHIYFGGTKGLNIINPRQLINENRHANIVFTDLRIFNKPVTAGNDKDVKENILYANEIILTHDRNFFTFEFASLDYNNPEKNQYAYMLEGFNADWIYNSNQHQATFTNLDPGEYTFHVKATNSSGVWNENIKSIKVILLPPWWQTWWAYGLYGLFFLTIIYSLRQYEMKRVQLRNELQIKDFESKKLKEVDQLKSHFFANISHEFRTPLTLIIGLLQKNKTEDKSEKEIRDIETMNRNAQRLLQLINQLLELSKIEAGKSKLSLTENDIIIFVKRILASFASYAEKKKLKLLFNGKDVNADSGIVINIYFDKDKMEKIISNLISNAVKYTPDGNEIEVKVAAINSYVLINVINTGITISPADQIHLFERYYKVHKAESGLFEGTGIGLALVKELVEMHKGSIKVTSEYDVTEFSIQLPSDKSVFSEDDFIIEKPDDQPEFLYTDINSVIKNAEVQTESAEGKNSVKPIVLIVEDHNDLRKYISETLSDNFTIIESQNGKEGILKADDIIPDLIISDVMMPEMDGYTFCKKIKSNEKTNHIPVILLTAKASTEDKLEGLELGADDYIVKPFNNEELKLRVKNLISTREQLRQKFTSEMILKPAEVVVPSTQVQFIEKLKTVIEENLESESFGVDSLSEKMGMSRSQLHRKLKAITNQTTTEFIRNFRLQRAAQLIMQDAGSMAEIAYKVGFNSQAYFNKSFQELFGCSPTEYRSRSG